MASRHGGAITNREPQKRADLAFSPLSALPEDLLPNVRQALSNALAGIAYSEYGWET